MRFVAIGDSFTEGVGDLRPDGSLRGWADLVALGLSAALAERGEPVEYANLAIRGRLLRPIVTDQLDAALALEPAADLLTLNGGGNDMLRPGVRLDDLLAMTEQAIRRCVEAGVRPVLLSGADPTAQLPLGRMVHRRAAYLTGSGEWRSERAGGSTSGTAAATTRASASCARSELGRSRPSARRPHVVGHQPASRASPNAPPLVMNQSC